MDAVPPFRRSTRHRWLLVLPFAWQVLAVPFVNDVPFAPLSIPFPMAWQMAGIVLASVVIGTVFVLDRRAGVEDEEELFLAAEQTGGER